MTIIRHGKALNQLNWADVIFRPQPVSGRRTKILQKRGSVRSSTPPDEGKAFTEQLTRPGVN